MVFLGIAGAETPMAKLMMEQIAQNRENYRICFRVDASYKENKAEAKYADVDSALLMVSATLVIDFNEDPNVAYENAKIYSSPCYHVPAILTCAGLDDELLDTLRHIRAAHASAPMLIVEPNLSVNRALLIGQAEQMLKVLGRDVMQINLSFLQPVREKVYMPIVEKLNQALGFNDWTPAEPIRNGRMYSRLFGFVQVTIEETEASEPIFLDGRYDLHMSILLKDSWLLLNETSNAGDAWRGLDMLAEYAISSHVGVECGEIYTNVLSSILRRRIN